MLDKILSLIQKLDLKWWISLKAQQALTILLAVMIILFFTTTMILFIQNQTIKDLGDKRVEDMRVSKNIEIVKERDRTDDCNESKFRLLEKYEILFFETQKVKSELKQNENENNTH